MATELSSIRLYICFLQVEGLQELTGLLFLDISFNMVQQLDAQQLPGSIKYFKAAGNPCMGQPGLAQQLAQHLPRLRELDGQDVSRSTAVTEGGSSKGQLAAAAGPRPGCLLPASADTVAAEVASRAERLRARLAAAGLQVQEAAEAAMAGQEAPDGAVAAMTGCYEQEDTAVSSSGAHNMFSSDDEAVCASPAQQAQASPAGSVPELHADINEDALEYSASAGSDSSSDSELESLVARMFKPAALPDWTSSGEAASFSQAGASRASSKAATDSDDETFRHMFAVSLPPGL
ncbi:hypothetical protein OEZ85_012008 [Tetradesmus obliquus]|uniref:U2A'/phosphoprotein 32 family A C-terminal domain-containing protein n=1 Tax=Tetradesmus obliquus TaxID=3088 RepID=A0ABY8TS63_TETOB|nr:hypothetical protein OEZ85_012008 [Tetradesmus obliquus]